MICPECGGTAHRSHSRTWREKLAKRFSHYKTYRCSDCRWRGLARPAPSANSHERKLLLFAWLGGIAIALAIGFYFS